MHQRVEPSVDVWSFHDPGDYRCITEITAFAQYALAESTESVVFTQDGPISGEIKAYGPREQYVWYEIPAPTDNFTGSMVAGLLKELDKADKLSVTTA